MSVIRVVDFETTGFPDDEGGAAVCEVGWCDVHNDTAHVRVEPPKSMLVNPGRPILPHIRAIHHIGDEDVAGAPPPEEAFNCLMAGPPDYFAAHHADFESAFFKGDGVPWICTYKVALRLYPDAVKHGNQALRYLLGLVLHDEDAMPPHRAGPDAYVTAHLLARFLSDGRVSIEEMVRWNTGPALLPRITFGKHFGKKWDEAPTDYLEWIVNKSDMDKDVMANARHHLKVRANAS